MPPGAVSLQHPVCGPVEFTIRVTSGTTDCAGQVLKTPRWGFALPRFPAQPPKQSQTTRRVQRKHPVLEAGAAGQPETRVVLRDDQPRDRAAPTSSNPHGEPAPTGASHLIVTTPLSSISSYLFFKFYLFINIYFRDRVSLCSPGWNAVAQS